MRDYRRPSFHRGPVLCRGAHGWRALAADALPLGIWLAIQQGASWIYERITRALTESFRLLMSDRKRSPWEDASFDCLE